MLDSKTLKAEKGERMEKHLLLTRFGHLDGTPELREIAHRVTYDFARLMSGAKEVKCSEFGTEIIRHM